LAKKKNLPIVPFSPSTVLRKFVGESSQLTKAVFSLCAKLEPCILFVDEADSLFRTRYDDDSSVDRNLKTEVMTHLDQLNRQGSRVLVIAATNRPQDIDAAIQRRFERSYLIGLPNEQTRVEVFRCLLRTTTCDPSLNLNLCAKATEGYSPSDILNVCKAAAQVPLRELRRKQTRGADGSASGVPRPLLLSDVEEALQSVIPTSWGSSAYNTILKQQQQQQNYPHQSQDGRGMGLGDGDAYNAPEGTETEDEEEDE
jgi:SpoVK/Ycf46/Vps4 family AAA+-type ATPase